jgi:hypothetical protein
MTASTPITRIDRIRQRLDRLAAVRDYYSQTGMPGRRWNLDLPGSSRSFSTAEVEAFIHGAETARRCNEFDVLIRPIRQVDLDATESRKLVDFAEGGAAVERAGQLIGLTDEADRCIWTAEGITPLQIETLAKTATEVAF